VRALVRGREGESAPSRSSGGRGLLPLVLLPPVLLSLIGCEGSNLFVGVQGWKPPVVEEVVDVASEVLRYFEEGTLLTSDEAVLRFRWTREPRLLLHSSVPFREREAFRRAAEALAAAGGPAVRVVTAGENAIVRALPPAEYREADPTRPWSHGRTILYANPVAGIYEADILISLGLSDALLDRVALHALGHLAGIMGHPSFPGGAFIMASQEEGTIPTRYHEWESRALRFLYSEAVRPGLTRLELRGIYAAWGEGQP